jgi:hypothetical protein
MKAMFLLFFIALLLTLVSGTPAIVPRQIFFPEPLFTGTPTACPGIATAGLHDYTSIPAATNIAAIPDGLLTTCQLECLGKPPL